VRTACISITDNSSWSQQARFDQFIEVFNHERPHEALDIEVSQIIIHKADQPYVVVNLFDPDGLTGKDLASHSEKRSHAPWDDDWKRATTSPRHNLSPVIRQHPKEPVRQVSLMKWGLIPYWAKDPSIATNTINAKSETAATKPAFRDPFKFRRCLIPADAFYEWRRTGAAKQPFCFEVNDGELFALAGLWDGWRDANGQWVKTCSILTTSPNAVTSAVHDRMPVILARESYDLWLDPGMQNLAAISELLKPYDAMSMRSYPVSTRINRVANDDEECSRRVQITEAQNPLFA